MSPAPYKDLLARNLRSARAAAVLSQDDVRDRMQFLGFKTWQRSTMSLVERAKRGLAPDEIAALALVLQTTIERLVVPPDDRDGQEVELPSGDLVRRSRFMFDDGSVEWDGNVAVFPAASARQEQIRANVTRLAEMNMQARERGADIELELDEGELARAAQPIVAAIITSAEGVLITRRHDGDPPWGFVTGKIEKDPAESPTDAAQRETKEETGLKVRAGRIIAELEHHPLTGRHMIYVAAKPVSRAGTNAVVVDQDELAEVKWASLEEALERMPTMYEPVKQYLAAELGGAQ
jgi:8-oxo-dGTP diphosphatase